MKDKGKIKKVTAFKTTDEELHPDINQAQLHQRDLDLRQAVSQILNEDGWTGMSIDDVVKVIADNVAQLAQVFERHIHGDPP